jgi:hypothetical protein
MSDPLLSPEERARIQERVQRELFAPFDVNAPITASVLAARQDFGRHAARLLEEAYRDITVLRARLAATGAPSAPVPEGDDDPPDTSPTPVPKGNYV